MSSTRLQRPPQSEAFEILVDDRPLVAFPGETIATVLLAAGLRKFHSSLPGPSQLPTKSPSRVFCGMGECLQCLVTVDGLSSCRACKTLARPGMKVETHI